LTIIKEIAIIIKQLGGRSFFVGGYVRDFILQRPNYDIDIECFGISADNLYTILSKFGNVKLVGKSFGVFKLTELPNYDFALPRIERKIGNKHTDFLVEFDPFLPFDQAAKRRDFTCNALMMDVLTGEILDFYQGISDCRKKILRHVNAETFIEDALRGLRACQFAGRLGFAIAPETQELIRVLTYEHLSIERVQGELTKGLLSKHPDIVVEMLYSLNIFSQLFPEIAVYFQDKKTFERCLLQLKFIGDNNFIDEKSQLATTLIFLLYKIPSYSKVLNKLTNNHLVRKLVKNVLHSLPLVQVVKNATDLRYLKNQISNRDLFMQVVEILYQTDFAFIENRYSSFATFSEAFTQAIQNNPTNQPLIQGRDLIDLGLQPNTNFKEILQQALLLEIEGYVKMEIIEILKKQLQISN